MITIDEIMAAAYAPAAMAAAGRGFCLRLAAAELRSIITQALAEARADGAREMRELCATVCDTTPPHPFRPSIEAAHAIRVLPLPGKREPVRLTDEQVRIIELEATLRGMKPRSRKA